MIVALLNESDTNVTDEVLEAILDKVLLKYWSLG